MTQIINLEHDYGYEETKASHRGKWPKEGDWDILYSVKDEDTSIFKPGNTLDGKRKPLAHVVVNAYPDNEVRDTLYNINETSEMRANAAGPIDHAQMERMGMKLGVDYKMKNENSYYKKMKNGKWGMIAYANQIHSFMIGYKRGRFTGAIDGSGWTKDKKNAETFSKLEKIAEYNENAFAKIDPETHATQKAFAENGIEPQWRIGNSPMTTLSVNRYSSQTITKSMSYHFDSGDTDAGLTTMCVFRQGDYDGAYLVFPRYRIAIEAPDNSVVIADSNQLHGVSEITGEGTRYSCVCYCDRRLATKGPTGKPEKLIGVAGKKNASTLEEFL